jgi:hypothetical protein
MKYFQLSMIVYLSGLLPMPAGLLDEFAVSNPSATNITVCFTSTDPEGTLIATKALFEWGLEKTLGNRTETQHSSENKPIETTDAIPGLRCLYVDDLQPNQTYYWKITVTATDGTTAEQSGEFKTLEVDTSRKRGPDGTHKPPHTPEYASPANHIAKDWSEVNALLEKCSGGEVIEMSAPDTSGEKQIVLTGGHEDWEKNVLIRPPLGQRSSNRSCGIEINSPNITVAGFNIQGNATMYPPYGNHKGNARGKGARRAFFWMCTLARQSTLLANGCPDSGWYELVALHRGVGGDRAQIKRFGDILPHNFTIAGCWLEGRDRTNKEDHSDTLQTLASDADPITGLRLINSLFFRSANCSGQMTHLKGLLVENSWFGPLQIKSKVCGSFYSVLTSCEEAIFRHSDLNGSFRQTVDPAEVSHCRFHQLKFPGKVSENNTVEGKLWPQPPPPDLDAIWPR